MNGIYIHRFMQKTIEKCFACISNGKLFAALGNQGKNNTLPYGFPGAGVC